MKKASLEQHISYGAELNRIRHDLMNLIVEISGTCGKTRIQQLMRALKAIEKQQSLLDDIVCNDFPTYEKATQVYYPRS